MLRAVPDLLQSAVRHVPFRAVCVADPAPAQGHFLDVTHHVTGFDAIASIGLTEHIGVANYPSYFGFLKSKLPNVWCRK